MNTTSETLRVALYARVSGEEQKQGHNIDSQILELEEYASRNEWPVIQIYKDEAWSGAALARPALDQLRDEAGKKTFYSRIGFVHKFRPLYAAQVQELLEKR